MRSRKDPLANLVRLLAGRISGATTNIRLGANETTPSCYLYAFHTIGGFPNPGRRCHWGTCARSHLELY